MQYDSLLGTIFTNIHAITLYYCFIILTFFPTTISGTWMGYSKKDIKRDRRGRDRMVVGFTTTYVIISNPTQSRRTRYNIMG